jgi:uncharacterized membrane protein
MINNFTQNIPRNKIEHFLLSLIIILAFLLRLYRINYPLADWHSWRQADTSAVTRNFIKEKIDLLHPKFDDLSSIPSGKPNPQGYRFVEFPVYNFISAIFYQAFDWFEIEILQRLISILFSLFSLILIYKITIKFTDSKTALLSSFFFAVLPFNIFYSRTILPEPMMVTLSLATIYFFILWLNEDLKLKSKFFLISLFFSTLSLLIKPYVLFLSLPLIYLLLRKYKLNTLGKIQIILFAILTFFPFFLWRIWMKQFPEGIPASGWLFNAENIRFKGAFFYWLFADRIGRLILGYWGIFIFLLGIILKPTKKEGLFFFSWLTGIIIYFFIIAKGNVTHDYYQIITLPIISIYLAKGASFLLSPQKLFNHFFSLIVFLICTSFALAFSWYHVRDFFNINHPEIVKAGRIADRLLPKNAKVIAPYKGDTAFLYQTRRKGWPIGGEVEDKIKQGANFYITFGKDQETEELMKKYKIFFQTNDFLILDLGKKK